MTDNEQSATSTGKRPAQEDKPTTPPRPSFGVELEFLVAEQDGEGAEEDPDAAIAHLLPPLYRRHLTKIEMQKCFERHGIPLNDGDTPGSGWEIDGDATACELDERRYHWEDVELIGPACYATQEAFDMIRVVVHLITTNFRCRVNPSCDFHVHIGHGNERIPLRQARNFGALFWAAEPLLTMLHPPERAFDTTAASIRRFQNSRLACGEGAESARQDIMNNPTHLKRAARYNGRGRKLGQAPNSVAIRPRHFLDRGAWDSDDEDWEADDSQPFRRPGKADRDRLEIAGDMLVNPGRRSIKRGPPELPGLGSLGPDGEAGTVEGLLSRRPAPFPRRAPRSDNHRPLESYIDGIPGRLNTDHMPLAAKSIKAERSDTWSGVKELLSCDVGTHQVAYLLTSPHMARYANLNWSHYSHVSLAKHVRLPTSDLDEAGQKARAGAESSIFVAVESLPRIAVECREAVGTLDGDWIATWARVLCGLLEFARDAEPVELMRVITHCAEATATRGRTAYDVVDLLDDIGCFVEARSCEERMYRGEEAWFDCMIIGRGLGRGMFSTEELLQDYREMEENDDEDGLVSNGLEGETKTSLC